MIMGESSSAFAAWDSGQHPWAHHCGGCGQRLSTEDLAAHRCNSYGGCTPQQYTAWFWEEA